MPGDARFVIVFVVDGLRPDAITRDDTPTLWRLRAEGVEFTDGHAVFPTVTRVNAATIATGTQPGTHGIVGNQIYVPAVDPRKALDTGNHRNLLAVDAATGGGLVRARTLAERLDKHGRRYAAVSSGSTGSAFLLNPRAPAGVGALVNGYFDPGKAVAYPAEAGAAILSRFGAAPAKAGLDRFDAAGRVDAAGAARVRAPRAPPRRGGQLAHGAGSQPAHRRRGLAGGARGASPRRRGDRADAGHAGRARPHARRRRLRGVGPRLHLQRCRPRRGRRARGGTSQGRARLHRRGARQQRPGGSAPRRGA